MRVMKGEGLVKIVVGIAVIIAILLAGWYLYLTIGKKPDTSMESPIDNAQSTETQNSDDQGGMSNSGSFMDLLALNATLECTFSSNNPNNNSSIEGTSYLAGTKMRVDYTSKYGETQQTGSMIKNGDYMYVWGDSMPQGVKMKIDPANIKSTLEEAQKGSSTPNSFDPTTNVDYNCKPWVAGTTKFDPPTDIEFTDLSSVMDNLKEVNDKMGSGSEDICNVCASLPSDQQAACKIQLGCQ